MNKTDVLMQLKQELGNSVEYIVIYDDWHGEWIISVKEDD